ncbi:uncharacterized protein LOC112459519 [Temnothorax curvispinosus]|uniref:Uncharacterized protein LOC112459519 n=1 Tax=Temnothorax curvispinosus TaxID=300111 RepID=A0A6J1QDL4_9HYME|nr:uncharacterized protein LOC112459519 [Temnothorax curvispinosus]
MIMAGPVGSKVLVTLTILALSGVSAIQNDKTSSRVSRDNIVLSANAYTGPEKTSSGSQPDESRTFQRTVPAFQLESSKNVNDYDREETRLVFKDTSRDESIDELTSSKHVAHIDGNNIEAKAGEYYHIVPTTSESMSGEGQGAPLRVDLLSEPHQLVGAPRQQAQHSPVTDQQRRGRQEIPRIYSEHAPPPPILQTAAPGHRQANPDIQDIITGIVKLLNGNVNVAANTVRPLRPIQATRINNRGPPRISDVPPLLTDFDTPGMNPPPPPPSSHPYPFEKPPAPDRPLLPPERPIRPFISGVPLPEQVVPPWSWDSSHRSTERYRPRPGIVLDDTLDYTGAQGMPSQRPYAPSRHPSPGDVFDVTVSAIQGPGGSSGESVRVSLNSGGDVILTSAVGGEGFVSIDGKRTYLNLFDNTERTPGPTHVQPQPTRTQPPPIVGSGLAIPQPDAPPATSRPNGSNWRQPPLYRRPTQPPVRIDTCIVGDTSTCDASQHEACATVQGVSACHCKPGYARLQHSLPCKKIVSIVVSIRVDKFYDKKVVWDRGLADKDTESYQTLAYEANRAVESAMSMTPFSDEYMGSLINNIYQGDVSQGQGGVFVNATLKLTYEPRTIRPSLAGELQRHLLGVIHRKNNNIGNSALYVDSPPGSISNLQDLDECASSELNDCHSSASCTNTFGGFTCSCHPGLKDPHKNDPNESGRTCLSCLSTYCNNRGTCSYQGDQMQCTCTGNYYGAQCEVDGEVLGVAIGASVAALIIIVLTLVCLVMWSRKWSREQKSAGSPVYGYIQGGIPGTLPGTLARVGSVGTLASVKQGPPTNLPPYMWAHFGEHMATANLYATEPMGPTRPSSAMFGYPPINVHGTLPPIPLPRLQAPSRPRQRPQPDPDSSDSEPQDKDRADLIPQSSGFHVPRPKSRSSLANQSGIYNDVEYDQGDVHHLSKNNIPMSTYRPYYRT